MTENEAKYYLLESMPIVGFKTHNEALEVAIKALEEIQQYRDAKEQGFLLRLPCKVGDNVYKIWNCGKNGKSVAEFRISHIDIDDLQNIEFAFISTKNVSTSYWFCKIGDFGATVFLTKEEAEQALAEMKGV